MDQPEMARQSAAHRGGASLRRDATADGGSQNPTTIASSKLGGPSDLQSDPRHDAGGGTFETSLRNMLQSGGPPPQPVPPKGPTRQHPHRMRYNQRANFAGRPQNMQSPPELLASPAIQQNSSYQATPRLQRSSTHPAQEVAPRTTPSFDRAGSFQEQPQYSPQNSAHRSPRYPHHYQRVGGMAQRQNGFRQVNAPQVNDVQHFPALGTPPSPLHERRQRPNYDYVGQGAFTNKQESPTTYHPRNASFQGSPQMSRGQPDSPTSDRTRRFNHHPNIQNAGPRRPRGGKRGSKIPLDYTYFTNHVTGVLNDVKPSIEETNEKTDMLHKIARICQELVPGAEIIPFGSLVSGFATKGADMDLIFTHPSLEPVPSSNDSNVPVRLAGEFLKRGFEVDLLIKTRVPILKIKTPSSTAHFPGWSVDEGDRKDRVKAEPDTWPSNVSCDIGFKAHLGITNSAFFRTYSQCDPRFQEIVLFVKTWAKKRDLNSPYFGTLSSYGYVLMVTHFLINVVQPAVLPNLQLIQPDPSTPQSEIMHDGFNIWYFKDLAVIRSGSLLPIKNEMSVGQLIHEFFNYYSQNFNFVSEMIAIRLAGGKIYKTQKGWTKAETKVGDHNNKVQDRYLLALEDPFETTHNVGRTCTGTGVRNIRKEMIRAAYIITQISRTGYQQPMNHVGQIFSIDDLLTQVKTPNGGFRNRRANQMSLAEWIKKELTVGECMKAIDDAAEAEKAQKLRELGVPDEENPHVHNNEEDDEDGESGSEEEEEEEESSSDDSDGPKVELVRDQPLQAQASVAQSIGNMSLI